MVSAAFPNALCVAIGKDLIAYVFPVSIK